MGHDVEIYSRTTPVEQKVHDDVEKYKLNTRTHYLDNVPKSKITRVLKALILLMKNFHINPFAILSSFNVFKYGREALSLYFFYNIIPFLGKYYDIIHCHFGPNGNFGIMLNSVEIKGKIIVTFHGYDLTTILDREGYDVYNELFLKADILMPISNHWKIKLLELGCSSNKIVVHHMGVNTDLFAAQLRNKNDISKINILSVGRLVEKKGFEFGIRAVAILLKKHPQLPIRYSIVGEGELRNHLEKVIENLGVSNKVKCLGPITQNEVKKLMMDAHLFILPSITAENGDQEGIPVVLMEAMAAEMPVISTFHTGIPELIQNGQSGFLVPERDIDALAHRLKDLIDHPELWPEMGSIGRKYIEAHYDIKKLNKKLVKIYEGLLSQTD